MVQFYSFIVRTIKVCFWFLRSWFSREKLFTCQARASPLRFFTFDLGFQSWCFEGNSPTDRPRAWCHQELWSSQAHVAFTACKNGLFDVLRGHKLSHTTLRSSNRMIFIELIGFTRNVLFCLQCLLHWKEPINNISGQLMNEMKLLERVTGQLKIFPKWGALRQKLIKKTVIAVTSLIFPVGWHSGSDNAIAFPLEWVRFWEMQDQNHSA